ncbi:hypothetical protein Terro_2628 [Terriglobus roseus DSM 18391]|uniref:Uncharacterized protein n=1 Tax=Terriglobus roseus (strain DSM 18391 / NRRL B-41598 / KBS 63) TaxID=926566 RepID=I3ZI00_TERRK|nr:hypothetical protein [Terriglobus roseus]AFL88528.1 hypothetical protein Terro_2264 [Terriglobus roseus DSM 18391]AFL88868.1 hypothetical protein Terro_2628 [Terriglobus roseus DSM 18391]
MMSGLIFVDILAYGGAALGVVLLYLAGAMLLRPDCAAPCLSVLIERERALECVQEGSFNASRARACGSLFLMFASFFAVCIVRALQRP